MKLTLIARIQKISSEEEFQNGWLNPITGEVLECDYDDHIGASQYWCSEHKIFCLDGDDPKDHKELKGRGFTLFPGSANDYLFEEGWILIRGGDSGESNGFYEFERFCGDQKITSKEIPALKKFLKDHWESFHDKELELTMNNGRKDFSYDQIQEM